ncbi:hypothetical protein MASR2M17_02310 [Aminivibrio sp.]
MPTGWTVLPEGPSSVPGEGEGINKAYAILQQFLPEIVGPGVGIPGFSEGMHEGVPEGLKGFGP